MWEFEWMNDKREEDKKRGRKRKKNYEFQWLKDERGEEKEKFECVNDEGEEEKEEEYTFVKMKVTRALGDEKEEY